MTAPLTTPLLLPSAYNDATNQDEPRRLLEQIIHASALLQGACHRRFDEYVATERYTARLVVDKGDLLSWSSLALNADLRSVTAIATGIPTGGAIGDGTALTDDVDIILSEDAGGSPAFSGRELALDAYSGSSFASTGNPRKSIGVTGVWGFGGQWVNTGTTVNTLQDSSSTSLILASASGLEVGMVFKVGSEYQYVEYVNMAAKTATVSRAYNGSTAASHAIAVPVYYWQAHPLVQGLIRRMVQWSEEQLKSPMATTVVIGEFSYPANTSGLPKDVFDAIYRAGLVALPDRIVKA